MSVNKEFSLVYLLCLQFPNAKTIILIFQATLLTSSLRLRLIFQVLLNITDVCVIQLECQTVCVDKSDLMIFVLALGNTTWWKKLKVWRLEINENIVRIGQCKADVCLLTLYKAKIGVSPSSILAYLTDLS